jgi:DNA-binding NarL/FixJ family response regulator
MPQLSAEDKGKIIGMHASGMSNGHIAEVLALSKPTVDQAQ